MCNFNCLIIFHLHFLHATLKSGIWTRRAWGLYNAYTELEAELFGFFFFQSVSRYLGLIWAKSWPFVFPVLLVYLLLILFFTWLKELGSEISVCLLIWLICPTWVHRREFLCQLRLLECKWLPKTLCRDQWKEKKIRPIPWHESSSLFETFVLWLNEPWLKVFFFLSSSDGKENIGWQTKMCISIV